MKVVIGIRNRLQLDARVRHLLTILRSRPKLFLYNRSPTRMQLGLPSVIMKICLFGFFRRRSRSMDNYGPLYIPKKGVKLVLNNYNLPIYERIIRVYEGNKLEVKDGKFFINGEQTTTYKFKMDYYWMMGDNRHNSADSRYWGFVPEDHIVGRPVLVWLSLNKDKGWFEGKIRFNRFFKNAEK